MTGFTVDPELLLHASEGVEKRSNDLAGLQSDLAAAVVPGGAFGWMPGIAERLETAYSNHIAEVTESVTSGKEGVLAAATGLAQCGLGYLLAEEDVIDALRDALGLS